jgi:hypothetical protein
MGNCLTGGMPLGMLDLPSVSTAIACQPALPVKTLSAELRGMSNSWGIPEEIETAAIHALRRDPSKRMLGFHFYEDPAAPYGKFERLHEKLGAELGHRFRPVIVLRGSSKMTPPDWWDEPVLRTSVRPSLTEPHSTVCGAMNPRDRQNLRKRFFELLGPAPQ